MPLAQSRDNLTPPPSSSPSILLQHTLPKKQLHTEVTESIITWIISCKMNAAVDLPVAIRDQLTVVSSLFGEMLASVEFADADSFDFSA
jgi:hypothetical protein